MPDGRSLVVADGSFDPPSLAVLPLEGGAPKRLSIPPKEAYGDFAPRVSPDGHSVAFYRALNTGGILELYRLSLNNGQPGEEKALRRQFGFPGSLSWSRDGKDLLISDEQQGQRTIIRVSATETRKESMICGRRERCEPASCGVARRPYGFCPRNSRFEHLAHAPGWPPPGHWREGLRIQQSGFSGRILAGWPPHGFCFGTNR